ncbi:MAG: NAD(P)-dependent oxidoreductase [Alphaproteobacteria bacterium]
MSQDMLKFVDRKGQMPDKRPAADRRHDWREVYAPYEPNTAAEQAARCSQCGVPFCQIHCPVQNNIPDWLLLATQGRMEEAYEVSAGTNNFPEICGRICPQDRLCEGNCVIEQSGHGTVTIGAVEKHITETAFAEGWVKPPRPTHERSESIGIVGAGPAGMAAAEQLRQLGYQVHVYDRYDRVGGLMVYGIPNFKLEKHVVQRRADLLVEGGIRFHLNFEVGRDASLPELQARHDAVLLATGVYKARELAAPGVGLANIVQALPYLTASNRMGLGETVADFASGQLNAAGKRVVVVGGGDTAMDCVRTAVRQGARSVTCLYRRDRENMPGSAREVRHAEEEGVEFAWLAQPEAFLGDSEINAIRTRHMRLGAADASGRRIVMVDEDDAFSVDADLAIMALGFDPEDMNTTLGAPDLAVTRWGTVRTRYPTMSTNLDGVFAAGDVVRGASLVVWAIREGRDAADGIHQWLASRAMTPAMAAE